MMKRFFSSIVVFFMCLSLGLAQQLPITNQYILNTYSVNPAFAGEHGNIEAFLGYRASWLGVEGAPQLSHVNLNAAIGETMGLGLTIQSESAGNFEHFHGNLAYAYHLQLGDDMWASMGLEAMFYRNQLDNTNVLSQGFDPVLANAVSLHGTTYDAGAGVGFWMKGITFGASAKRLMGSSIDYGGSETKFFYKPNMHINAFLSYSIPLGKIKGGAKKSRRAKGKPKFRVEPMAMVHYTSGSLFYDATVNVMFKDRIWAGALYRTDGSVGVHLGGALQERIIMSYAYEFGLGQTIASQSSGTHEISIGFLLKAAKKNKRGRTLFLLDPLVGGGGDPELEKKLDALTEDHKKLAKKSNFRIDSLGKELLDLKKKVDLLVDNERAAGFSDRFVINNIRFAHASDRLFPSSYSTLNLLAHKLKKNMKWDIKIIGHTDNVGSKSYNKRLSKKRAESVKKYLIRQGVLGSRITTEGKGSEDPVNKSVNNNLPANRAKNRRIEGAFRKNK